MSSCSFGAFSRLKCYYVIFLFILFIAAQEPEIYPRESWPRESVNQIGSREVPGKSVVTIVVLNQTVAVLNEKTATSREQI